MSTWNDDRLDELSRRTDAGFEEVKGEIKELSRRTDEGFKEIRQEFKEIRQEFKGVRGEISDLRQEMSDGFAQVPTRAEMNQHLKHLDAKFDAKFDRLNHTLIIASATIVAAILANGIFG